MTENDLLLKIEGLEKIIQEKNADAIRYQDELKQTKQELVDLHKPELTPQQLEAIEGAVEQAVSEFDFTDTENFEIDYSLDYDGRVQCESHDFINDCDLVEMIVNRVCKLFKEIEDESTDTKQ
jgi:DNA gyrase/topoisomerase IV subunit A